jgi:two-component system response regulator YesN
VEANGGDVLQTVSAIATPEKMFAWFLSIATRLREIALHKKMSNSSVLLDNALAYMRTNFTDPLLNLESTCEAIGISVSYLSLLFKKNLGKSFVKYLTELRLDKARELLKYSSDRIIEIAEKCGYNDVYYFSHSFKKSVGMSPKKYRENQNPS